VPLIALLYSTELLTEEQKQDLKATVEGLSSCLSSIQENAEREREEFAAVVREHAQMMQQIKEMERLTELADSQQSEITALQQVSVCNVDF